MIINFKELKKRKREVKNENLEIGKCDDLPLMLYVTCKSNNNNNNNNNKEEEVTIDKTFKTHFFYASYVRGYVSQNLKLSYVRGYVRG